MLIKNVSVFGKIVDILIKNNKIVEIGENIKSSNEEIIEADGLNALPAFVDMHVHLREPGFENKENMESGLKAAVKGGFSAIACMPNTRPVCDNKTVLKYIKYRAEEINLAKVYPIASVTKGQEGKELTNMLSLYKEGAVAFSDDGRPIMNANIMRLALEYTRDIPVRVLCHEEDLDLANGGCINEGATSVSLGLPGITRAAEEVQIARDIQLAKIFKTKVHICHISTKGSVELIRGAKAQGVDVTCESCPHYIALTDIVADGYNTLAKVNPPIREEDDRIAIIAGFLDGTIDALVTDHAPHAEEDKCCDFTCACNGISGLETSFSIAYTYLVKNSGMKLEDLSALMTRKPAEILNIDYCKLNIGDVADIVLVDLNKKYKIDRTRFVSKGKNSPFDGKEVYGEVVYTIVNGEIKYKKEN